MVDFEKIIKFLHELSFPRATGMEGDQKAQKLIKEKFSEIPGTQVADQEFSISRIYMNGVLKIIHPAIGVLILINFGLLSYNIYDGALLLSIILFAVSFFNRELINMLQFRVQRLGNQISARNIWIELKPSNEIKQNLVFLAHYDSISHRLSPIIEALGYIAGFLGGIIFALHSLIYLIPVYFLHTAPGSVLQLIWGVPIACIALIELVNVKGNKSDGAIDNASAVAQCYHLALSVSQQPIKNTRIIIVATGAEEWGDYGAFYFVKENPCKLSKENTRFIIVDSIGTADKGKVIYGIGLPIKHWSNFLEEHARTLIKETGAPLEMQAIPPLLQISSDHVPVENKGYEFIWFATNTFIIHSPKDNIAALHKENFQQVCEFIEQYVRRIDSTL